MEFFQFKWVFFSGAVCKCKKYRYFLQVTLRVFFSVRLGSKGIFFSSNGYFFQRGYFFQFKWVFFPVARIAGGAELRIRQELSYTTDQGDDFLIDYGSELRIGSAVHLRDPKIFACREG